MLHIEHIDTFVLRFPIEAPVRTSFGTMRDRPAVFVRVTDADGVQGWGEVWCNFPAVGAEHRARLIASVFQPLVERQQFGTPAQAFADLTSRTEVLALQSAEPGPIAQCIAGIDTALWDLHARRLKQPLWRLLGGTDPSVKVYASGLNPTQPERLAAAAQEAGFRAFKLKIGFGPDLDRTNLRNLRHVLGSAELMVDANQAWTLKQALDNIQWLNEFRLRWVEEPLKANRPWSEWKELAGSSRNPLAAGENLAGDEAFDVALAARCLGVVQPDLAKWGGISACLPVAQRILAAGMQYCPHYLGAGIGLLASAHLLAGVGGDGSLEVDINPNRLRTATCGPVAQVCEGKITLSDAPGLGAEPDLSSLSDLLVPVW